MELKMAKKIYKYRLFTDGAITSLKDRFTKIMAIQNQMGGVYAWIELDDDSPVVGLDLVAIGTGWEFGEELNDFFFVDTVQEGEYVWHFFGRIIEEEDLGG